IPVWTADYVLNNYGTGAIMAVPAHDIRDYEFAQTFELPILQVISTDEALPYSGSGSLVNSGAFSGKVYSECKQEFLSSIKAKEKVRYRLRDWLVSRQRFWGAPIPIAYDQDGNDHLLPENQLPVELPTDVDFLPTGQSPLATAKEWKEYIDPQT